MNETLLSLRCLWATCQPYQCDHPVTKLWSLCLPEGMFKTKRLKRKKKQPTAVPLDGVPDRRTMTIHHEILARGSLMPTGDTDTFFSQQGSEGGKSRPLDHTRQIPFV